MEVRVRTGQNIGYDSRNGGEMFLTLKKFEGSRYSDKYEVYSPVIRIMAAGGKGCQTRAQNPTCTGFWDWTGGMPTCLLK